VRRLETADDIEKALLGLMPVALSDRATEEIEGVIDELSGEVSGKSAKFVNWPALTGVAAAIAVGLVVFFPDPEVAKDSANSNVSQADGEVPEMVFLAESDRVEGVEDEGLFVDTGGSAVRKLRVRVVVESRLRDEETGFVVMLTEPRDEFYMVPVSEF